MRPIHTLILLLVVLAGLAGTVPAQEATAPEKPAATAPKLTTKWLEPMRWRSIGPANMGGRITALAVYEKDPCIWWAATASGGLLKTVNNGVTFEHQFDKEATVSIGDVAVAQSNPDIVWVGTGESNPRNSVSWGDGVYKSVDGGKTWKHMGLKESFQIGAVRIHPTNPDIVYVGALGRLYGPNPGRGLFKTTDGGKTWSKVLYVDDKTGVIDVQMNPKDPDTLLIATYERQRDGFDTNSPAKRWGPGSGVYKTTDGGRTFKKVTAGLPTCQIGRIGMDYYRSNPNVIFMVLESEKIGMEPENAPYVGITGTDADAGAKITQVTKDGPAEKAGLKKDDIVIAVDGQRVHSYNDFLKLVRQHEAGHKSKLEVSRARKSVEVEITFTKRPAPQPPRGQQQQARQRRGPPRPFGASLSGQRANMQDQQGKAGHEFGGIYKSVDGGESWTRINSLNPRPMYFSEMRVDPSDEKLLYVLGIRAWRSKDGGATFTSDFTRRGVHVDHHALWINPEDGRMMVLGNDGGIYVTYDRAANWDHLNTKAIGQFYHVGVGPRRNYKVYGGLQDNGSWGGPSRVRNGSGPINQDWIRVGGGDGFICRVDKNDPDLVYFESQNGGIGRRNFRTGQRSSMRPRGPRGQGGQRARVRYRFNWQTPFILSNHNSKIYYTAGNHVFRSLDRGNGLKVISPEIAHGERGSATSLSESPLDPNVLYVGTDDGAFWMTKNGGHDWIDLYKPYPVEEKKPEPAPGDVTPAARTGGEATGEVERAVQQQPGRGGRRGQRMEQMLQRMKEADANGDGKLQKSEVPDQMQRFFDRVDANQDNVLDEAELKAVAERFAQRQAEQEGEQPGEVERTGRERPRGRGTQRPEVVKKEEKKAPETFPIYELMKERRWVSSIEASRYQAGRAYLTFDGHRSDDYVPHVFVTEDFGKSWRSLRANLPDSAGSVHEIQEDIANPNLLYLGCEFGAWASIDRGESWVSLNTNLPTVAIHGFAQHQTAGEVVVATHGRSLWILDVTTLRQLKPETMVAEAHLYKPNSSIIWRSEPGRGNGRGFRGSNPSSGAHIYYSLAKKVDTISMKILGLDGKVMRELQVKGEAGLHRVTWNMRRQPTEAELARIPARFRNRSMRFGRMVRPGTYKVRLEAGNQTMMQDIVVELDPEFRDGNWITFQEEAELLAADDEEEEGDDDEKLDD